MAFLGSDAMWHSGKPRAQQTGELLAKAIGALDRIVQREGLEPKDQVTATKEALQQTSAVMIVGHLPFLGKLVALLVTGNEEFQKSYFMLSDAGRTVLNTALEKYRPGQTEPIPVGGQKVLNDLVSFEDIGRLRWPGGLRAAHAGSMLCK